jgi:hypothetical protein
MTQVRHVVSKIPYILIYLVAGMGIALVAYVVFLSLQPDPPPPAAKRLCIPRC